TPPRQLSTLSLHDALPISTPANFAAGASEGVVRLTWDAVPSGGAELGYRVYRKASHDPAAALLATLPLTAASYNDSTPASGATRSEEHTSELQSRGHLVCR